MLLIENEYVRGSALLTWATVAAAPEPPGADICVRPAAVPPGLGCTWYTRRVTSDIHLRGLCSASIVRGCTHTGEFRWNRPRITSTIALRLSIWAAFYGTRVTRPCLQVSQQR